MGTNSSATSEAAAAAYALIMLLDRAVLPRSRANEAAKVLGLTTDQLAVALSEYETRGRRPPSTAPLVPAGRGPVEGVNPSSNHRGRHTQTKNMRDGADGPERRCARCEEWFPATTDHFGWKNREHRLLRSYCHECWNIRQGATYLSIARREALGQMGVVFTVPEGSDRVGLRCVKCLQPIVAGHRVTGEVHLAHENCLAHPAEWEAID